MDPTERRTRIIEEAADWWVHLRAEHPRREDREQFVDWLRESPLHVAEMLRIAQVHGALESFDRWTKVSTEESGVGAVGGNVIELDRASKITRSGDEAVTSGISGRTQDNEIPDATTPSPLESQSRRRRWPVAVSLAASLAVVALAATWFIATAGVIETERGERREVALADGSVVQISPESRLRVSFEEHERRVTLDRGAALFRVAKDKERPFLVAVDRTVVRAVGTAFGVERRDRDIVVTVSEGRVEVNEHADDRDPGASPLASPLALNAGEQVTVIRARYATEQPHTTVRKVDTSRELAWAEGRLVFEGASIEKVIAQFNRYNRIQLRVTDSALAQRPISGVFDASDPESFIAFVATVTPVKVERDNNQNITLAPSAP